MPGIEFKKKLWHRRRSVDITNSESNYRVVYLGNVITGWAKGSIPAVIVGTVRICGSVENNEMDCSWACVRRWALCPRGRGKREYSLSCSSRKSAKWKQPFTSCDGCVEKPLATLWKNYCHSSRPDIPMKLTVCNSGLEAVTRDHGLTEYWANRITYCVAHSAYPKLFCWVYRHEGRKMKQELRCHAVLCNNSTKAETLANDLNEKLRLALYGFKREKIVRQTARLSIVNAAYGTVALPIRKQHLVTSSYRLPIERSKAAPKLGVIHETLEEGTEDFRDELNAILEKIMLFSDRILGSPSCLRSKYCPVKVLYRNTRRPILRSYSNPINNNDNNINSSNSSVSTPEFYRKDSGTVSAVVSEYPNPEIISSKEVENFQNFSRNAESNPKICENAKLSTAENCLSNCVTKSPNAQNCENENLERIRVFRKVNSSPDFTSCNKPTDRIIDLNSKHNSNKRDFITNKTENRLDCTTNKPVFEVIPTDLDKPKLSPFPLNRAGIKVYSSQNSLQKSHNFANKYDEYNSEIYDVENIHNWKLSDKNNSNDSVSRSVDVEGAASESSNQENTSRWKNKMVFAPIQNLFNKWKSGVTSSSSRFDDGESGFSSNDSHSNCENNNSNFELEHPKSQSEGDIFRPNHTVTPSAYESHLINAADYPFSRETNFKETDFKNISYPKLCQKNKNEISLPLGSENHEFSSNFNRNAPFRRNSHKKELQSRNVKIESPNLRKFSETNRSEIYDYRNAQTIDFPDCLSNNDKKYSNTVEEFQKSSLGESQKLSFEESQKNSYVNRDLNKNISDKFVYQDSYVHSLAYDFKEMDKIGEKLETMCDNYNSDDFNSKESRESVYKNSPSSHYKNINYSFLKNSQDSLCNRNVRRNSDNSLDISNSDDSKAKVILKHTQYSPKINFSKKDSSSSRSLLNNSKVGLNFLQHKNVYKVSPTPLPRKISLSKKLNQPESDMKVKEIRGFSNGVLQNHKIKNFPNFEENKNFNKKHQNFEEKRSFDEGLGISPTILNYNDSTNRIILNGNESPEFPRSSSPNSNCSTESNRSSPLPHCQMFSEYNRSSSSPNCEMFRDVNHRKMGQNGLPSRPKRIQDIDNVSEESGYSEELKHFT